MLSMLCRGDGASCEGSEERDIWWMERGDFSVPHQHNDQSESTETDQSEHTGTKVLCSTSGVL